MCGIFAYLNFNATHERRHIVELLFNGLRRLEHRGYDCAGISIDADPCRGPLRVSSGAVLPSPPPLVFRQEGKIENLVSSFYHEAVVAELDLELSFTSHAGIAHTRWATHGEPSPINSHPQTSGEGNEFLVVHNGIVTNYMDLKETLLKYGFHFESDTDTEVIPKLALQLEGAYALIFKSPYYPNELVACKRGSPLLLGVKETGDMRTDINVEMMPTRSWKHTRKVLVIEDNEVVHMKDGAVHVFKFDSDKSRQLLRPASVQRGLSTLEMEVEQIRKGNFEHFMQKKIQEQPDSLTMTMSDRLIRGGEQKAKGILLGRLKDHLKTIRRSRRILFIGCGTSYNAALAARPVIASDLLDRQGPIYREDTAIFVSQSGETADTLQALEYAKSNGALCVAITNTVCSAIARGTHCGIHLNAGCEIGVASTKAYTSQNAVIQRRNAIMDDLYDLPSKVRDVLKLDKDMKELAALLMDEQSLLVFGRGYNYATALECALKVKEVSLMHAEGIVAGEMKHGPLALVDETLPIIVIATRDASLNKQQSVIQQLKTRKGRLIDMCTEGDAEFMCPDRTCRIIEVPKVQDCLQPIINIVPLQLLAYHLTVFRGFNVDQPRNLAKSVTTQ
ncbi:hypothetical protein KP509_38G060400 [Ceratopteris richardii]|uniref:glutamine--fructose-6-phosphate transaminase (isomerizing) n=1 Tax=Ceratopteris richardii TaxID=49495 RepID=A0A8T2Q5D9_CERRI|nr:hypothetical protein KP509_38G060400 [Ceratopteris richardii]